MISRGQQTDNGKQAPESGGPRNQATASKVVAEAVKPHPEKVAVTELEGGEHRAEERDSEEEEPLM